MGGEIRVLPRGTGVSGESTTVCVANPALIPPSRVRGQFTTWERRGAVDPSDEEIIAHFAGRQHGVVTRAQLLEGGLTRRKVERRVQGKRLRPLHRGVYLAGPVAPPRAREMAALLSCGTGAVISHRSAAVLWRLLPDRGERQPVDVTTPGADRGRRAGIRGHRSSVLPAEEVTVAQGIGVTAPARTLLDLASGVSGGDVSQRELEQALARAERQQLVEEEELRSVIVRHPSGRGTLVLRRMLQSIQPALTRSEAEESFLALVRKATLPAPEVNVVVGRHEVDFLWRSRGVAVEVDGFAFHSSRARFEADRRRDAQLAADGIQVIRVTWRQITDEREAMIARLAGTLARANSP